MVFWTPLPPTYLENWLLNKSEGVNSVQNNSELNLVQKQV